VQCREHLADNTKLKYQLAECIQNYEKVKVECKKLSDRLGSGGVVPMVETMPASDAMVDPPSIQALKGRANRHTRGRHTRGRGTGSGTSDDT
jgi:regulator of replication initiation timing